MDSGGDTPGSTIARVWLELDLEAQPIEGTLTAPDGPATPFVGWLGLTVALEGLRSDSTGDQ
jgi:hypothetical protein